MFMLDITRETIAYVIIGLIVVAGAPAIYFAVHRRRRRNLRRRGIKRYGH